MKNKWLYTAIGIALFLGACDNRGRQHVKQEESRQATVKELISADDFDEKLGSLPDAQLVDVRTPGEFAGGHLNGAKNIDWNGDFAAGAEALDKKRPVLVYCLGGGRSAQAAEKLQEMGFATVYDMEGGYMKWTAAGKPVTGAAVQPAGMSAAEYEKRVTAGSKEFVLVDFYAQWCSPCQKMAPALDKLAASKKETLLLLRIDADSNKALLKAKQVDAIPYFELYRQGKLIWKHNGYLDEKEFLKESGL